MFDMGFTEMVLIGIVALIVIGPERLPGVARTAGKYVGRLKRFMTSVKADVEQELRADELRQILSQQQKELDTLKSTISDAGHEIEREANLQEAVSESAGDASPPEATPAAEPAVEAASEAVAADTPPPTPADPPAEDAATANDSSSADASPEEPARKAGS